MSSKAVAFGEKTRTLLLLLPWLATFAVFWLYPLLYALYLSFTRYSTLRNTATWIGLDNYRAIADDPLVWQALLNTGIFTFGTVPFTIGLALFLAVGLQSNVHFRSFLRAAYFLPSVTSLVVLALIFSNLYAQDGYINRLLAMVGLPIAERGWLLEPSTALFSVMAMDIWISAGYYTILILAGLQSISDDLYESATLAGANAWQRFRLITLPLLRPTLLFVVVINTIKSFQVFVEIYIMTKGGPLNKTTTLLYLVFESAFTKSDMMGYASALAFLVFGIILVFSMIQMKVLGFSQR